MFELTLYVALANEANQSSMLNQIIENLGKSNQVPSPLTGEGQGEGE